MRTGFKFHAEYYEATKFLSDEIRGLVYVAIVDYLLLDKEPEIGNEVVKAVFGSIRGRIDSKNARYKNGCKGGAPEGNNNAFIDKGSGIITENNLKQPNNNLIQPNSTENNLKQPCFCTNRTGFEAEKVHLEQFDISQKQEERKQEIEKGKESSKESLKDKEVKKVEDYIPLDSILDNNIYRESSLHSDSLSKSGDFDPQTTKNDQINFSLLASFWNETLEKAKSIIPKIRKIDEERRKSVLARVREYSKEDLMEMIQKVSVSDFLNGKNDRGWVATFDWCIKPRNFKKIIEDNYNNTNIQNGNYQQGREYDRRRGVPAGGRNPDDFDSDF